MNRPEIRVDDVRVVWEDDQHFLCCRAVATVSYPCGNLKGTRRIETLTSAGLYGIDDESTPEYKHEIELDELSALRDHLEVFGIQTRNFASRFAPSLQR